MSSRSIHAVPCARISFLLKTNNGIIFRHCTYVHNILLIHWWLGTLGYVHILTTINNAAVNMVYKYLFRDSDLNFFFFVVLKFELRTLSLLGRHSTIWAMLSDLISILLNIPHSDIELADHMVILFLIWGMAKLFPIMTTPFYIPTNSTQGFQFPQTLKFF
jgi:hypothetical protein